jgi:hypothetical protein
MKTVSRITISIVLAALLAGCGADRDQERQTRKMQGFDRAAVLETSLLRLQSDDIQQRCIGAGDLGKAEVADATAYEPLRDLMFNDPEPQVRRHAAYALRDDRYVSAMADLIRCLRTEPERSVRSAALDALAIRQDPAAIHHLRGVVEDSRERPALREQAIEVLGLYGTEEAAQVLCEIVREDYLDRDIREAALDELAGQTPVTAPAFTRLMRSEGIDIYANNGTVDRTHEQDFGSDRYMRSLVSLYRSIKTTRDRQAKLGLRR